MASRARPCASRTRLLELIATQTVRCAPPPRPTQLRCFSFDPQKYIKSIELGPPTSKAFFFPLDHMQTEEAMKCEVPCHRPPIAASLILPAIFWGQNYSMTGATIRPNFSVFPFFCFWIFSFCYSLLFLISFIFYSYSSLLILLFLSLLNLLVGTILCFLILLFLNFKLFVVLQT